MQTDIKLTAGPQNFGMAFHTNRTINNIICTRLKKTSDVEKLNKIFNSQSKNDKVDITLFVERDNKTLSANLYAKNCNAGNRNNRFFRSYTETILGKLLGGPLGFLEKCARVADKQAAKIRKKETYI